MTEPDYLSIIRKHASGTLDEKMGITITEASLTRLVGTMPVQGNTRPMGILHGGANVVLAESLGSIGTQLNAGENRTVVGIDINATHHKATSSGVVTGVATAVSIGKTLCCWDIVITNEDGQRTCTARITCMILAER
jgi:uncharacterized protein (TIGR00369 family)